MAPSPADAGETEPHHDGVNEDAWGRLSEIVSAANRGDGKAHTLAILRWPGEVPLAIQQRVGVYLLYLLWRQVKTLLRPTPTPEDLHELAVSAYPRFREILTASEAQLEEVLRRSFEFPPLHASLAPGDFGVFSSVALGVLLAHPEQELEAMRPGLASWLRRNKERFRAEGLLEDPSG